MRSEIASRIEARKDPANWVDLRDLDLSGADLTGMRLERVVFGRHREAGTATLSETLFRDAVLVDCQFSRVRLREVDLRGAEIVGCDFRYAAFEAVTFANALISDSDFYRAQFAGAVVFESARLERVSLTNASLAGIVGLARESLDHRGVAGLVQEDEDSYRDFLLAKQADRRDDVSDAVVARLEEAALVYRQLSGLWSSQGATDDASWAYVRGKRYERDSLSPRHAGTPTSRARWLALTVADLTSGFGESLGRVAACVVVIGVLPGLVWAAANGVEADGRPAGLADSLLYSLGTLATAPPDRLAPTGRLVEWVGVIQTLLGIASLGLLGFVLGNKLRQS